VAVESIKQAIETTFPGSLHEVRIP
jgi:hypothetical protein